MKVDLVQLKSLMRALRRYDLTELELQQGSSRIVLRRGARGASADAAGGPGAAEPAFPIQTGDRQSSSGLSAPPGAPGSNSAATAPAAPAPDPLLVTVTSPLVGTFYRASAPGARPFVEVGATVRPGTVLCIIEAMKLMNEIECEHEGTVAEVLVENGRPVEFGQPLLRVRRGG
ncbi:MAG: acetyl-CoA carboxylase biotin carboxyl carrier protein [Deltaproteobacteria bacterium]|nr:acetyl-CoA carboxylase biotin carboxyl carrier protein [Deltaproteobacteria bacterium]